VHEPRRCVCHFGFSASDSLANIDRQRQHLEPAALASDRQLTTAPVDVVNCLSGDLAALQTQPGQDLEHGVVPQPHSAPITGREHPGDMVSVHRVHQP
jgi:hypothetical protein